MADCDSQVPAIEMIERESEQALLESESDDQPVPAASGTELDHDPADHRATNTGHVP